MNEVLEKYFSKDSSFKHYHEPITEQPTITICFSPHMDDNGNEYYKDYEYSTDFTINFYYENIDKSFILGFLNMTENKFNDTSKADIMVKLEKIYTIFSGLCYKITPVSNVSLIEFYTDISLYFNKSIPYKDVPSLIVYFTSQNNSYGIIANQWTDGEVRKMIFEKNRYYSIDLKVQKTIYLDEKHHCSNDLLFYECYSALYLTANFDNCTSKCSAFSLLMESMESYNIPLCNNTKEFVCAREVALDTLA